MCSIAHLNCRDSRSIRRLKFGVTLYGLVYDRALDMYATRKILFDVIVGIHKNPITFNSPSYDKTTRMLNTSAGILTFSDFILLALL